MKLSQVQALTTAAFGVALLIAPAASTETQISSAGQQTSGLRDGGQVRNYNLGRRTDAIVKRRSSKSRGGQSKRARSHRSRRLPGMRFQGGGR